MGCSALRQGLRGAGLGKHAVYSAAFAWFGIRRESFRGFCGRVRQTPVFVIRSFLAGKG